VSVESAVGLAVVWPLLGIPLIAVIRRLSAPRTEFTSTVSPVELFFNRLLLDRDIRDGRAWVSRNIEGLKEEK